MSTEKVYRLFKNNAKVLSSPCYVGCQQTSFFRFNIIPILGFKSYFPKVCNTGVKCRSLTDKTQIGSDWCHRKANRRPWQDSWNLISAFNAPSNVHFGLEVLLNLDEISQCDIWTCTSIGLYGWLSTANWDQMFIYGAFLQEWARKVLE